MRVYLAHADGKWLQRIDTRRLLEVPKDADPVAWLKRAEAEFTAGRANFLVSVAEQFGLDPKAVTVVERELDGTYQDAPYLALHAALSTGTFEGRPVVPPIVKQRTLSARDAAIEKLNANDSVKAFLREFTP